MATLSSSSSSSSSSSTMMSKEERYALMEKFLGFPPKEFLEDIYRAGEDYICDSIDQIEKEFLSLGEQIQHKKTSKQGRNTTNQRSSSTTGPTESQLHEEIAQGMEKLWNILLSPYEHVGDMFEVYCLKNIFAWPIHVPLHRPAGSGRIYTVQEEKMIDNRINKLEEAIMKERRRKRTLLHIRDLYNKRLPQAEAASLALDSMANEMLTKGIFATSSSSSSTASSSSSSAATMHYSTKDTTFTDFLERGTRLKALCDRLAAASPEIAQQMIEVTEEENFLADNGDDDNNENNTQSTTGSTTSSRKKSSTKTNNDTTALSSANPNTVDPNTLATNILLQKFNHSVTSLGGGSRRNSRG